MDITPKLEPHHRMQFRIVARSLLFRSYPLSGNTVSVLWSRWLGGSRRETVRMKHANSVADIQKERMLLARSCKKGSWKLSDRFSKKFHKRSNRWGIQIGYILARKKNYVYLPAALRSGSLNKKIFRGIQLLSILHKTKQNYSRCNYKRLNLRIYWWNSKSDVALSYDSQFVLKILKHNLVPLP